MASRIASGRGRTEYLHERHRRSGVAIWDTKKASPRLSAQAEAVLGTIDTLPFDSPGDEIYGTIRTQLQLAVSRIDGLGVENWLRD